MLKKQTKLTKKYLHKIEMELVYLCDNNMITREAIIDKFTNLMSELDERAIKINPDTNNFGLITLVVLGFLAGWLWFLMTLSFFEAIFIILSGICLGIMSKDILTISRAK